MSKTVRRRGFTLPEILVTVTVVAVLAAVVVPAVTQFAGKGDGPSTTSDLGALRTGVTSYVSVNRSYPSFLSDLAPYAAQLSLSGTSTAATFTSGGYGLTFRNDINNDTTVSGTHYVRIGFTGTASHGSCSEIDAAIDGGNGNTQGSFRYGTDSNPCSQTTSTPIYLLMPR